MVAAPGAGVGVVAPTVGTSPTVVARSATGVSAVVLVVLVALVAGRAGGLPAARCGALAADAGAAVPLSGLAAAVLPSCWRVAGAWAAGCAAIWDVAGAAWEAVAFVAAGCTAHAASGIRNTDANSAPAPPLRMRASKLAGADAWAVASYEVAGGQAGARVDIIYSIF
jgi:hypothetical protein